MAQEEEHAVASLHTAEERARAAEWRVAAVRAIVIGFNIAVWIGVLRDGPGIPWLAAVISVVAASYAAFVLLGRPDRVWPATATATFTAVTDSLLIALWLVATGGAESPFWPLWFVSLLAIAFRATMAVAFLAGLAYAGLDLLILVVGGAFDTVTVTPVVRVVYIVLMGALAALVAAEGSRQVSAQIRYRREAEEAESARGELDLLQRMTHGLAGAEDLDAALQVVLDAAGAVSDWRAGEAWVPRDGRLVCSRAWHAGGPGLGPLRAAAQGMSLGPGEGLAGRAWASGQSVVVQRLEAAAFVPRRDVALRAGLGAAVAVPVAAGDEIVAVLTFFMPRFTSTDQRRVSLLRGAAAQVGPEMQRKEAEARLRVFTRAAFEGLCIHDDGRVLEANPAFARLFGLDGARDRRLQDLVHPDDRRALEEHLELEGRAELRFTRADGTSFDAEIRSHRVPFRGAIVRVSALQDITERKRMQEADRLALERQMEITRLQEVDRIRTQLLNVASHELNTPLTPLRLQLHLLTEGRLGPLNEGQTKAVGVLDRNVRRLSSLVGDILDVARLQAGRLRVRPTEVDISSIVHESAETFAETAREHGIRLTTDIPGPVRVQADPDRVGQVVVNLVSNAMKYAERAVHVTCTEEPDGAEITVSDDGVGLDQDQLDRLFKPFGQVQDEEEQKDGTGLGLYICRGIVDRHGGHMDAESGGRGKGTTFRCWLPREAIPEED